MRINETHAYQIPIRSSVWTALDAATSYGCAVTTAVDCPGQSISAVSGVVHLAAAVMGDNNGITRTGMNIRRTGHVLAALGQFAALAGMGLASVPITVAGDLMVLAVNACADSYKFE